MKGGDNNAGIILVYDYEVYLSICQHLSRKARLSLYGFCLVGGVTHGYQQPILTTLLWTSRAHLISLICFLNSQHHQANHPRKISLSQFQEDEW